jgi:hypothetical protein
MTAIPAIFVEGNHAEIARKKQDRGMVTAWNTYQEKLNKQQAGRQKRGKLPEDAAAVIQWISKTVTKLDGLDRERIPQAPPCGRGASQFGLDRGPEVLTEPDPDGPGGVDPSRPGALRIRQPGIAKLFHARSLLKLYYIDRYC